MTHREVEILRTLARIRFLRIRDLEGRLFAHRRRAQIACASLRRAGFITEHKQQCLPSGGRTASWYRLTEAGMAVVAQRFPADAHFKAAVARSSDISLVDPRHQASVAALYLSTLAVKDPQDFTARATKLRYSHDHDACITVAMPGGGRELYPDAVYESDDCRVFVELDRSSKPLNRIADSLRPYGAMAAGFSVKSPFPDDRPAHLLFVTRTKARAKNIQETAARLSLGSLEMTSLPFLDAVDWLRHKLYGDPRGLVVSQVRALLDDLVALVTARDAGTSLPEAPTLREVTELKEQLRGIGQ